MSELTISISDKADALIAQLQKEIFNRRRKKVTKEKVVETLLESGAKSQSDKRFATSWQNLLADIERAAMVAQTHGSKPSSLSDEEWALVLSHRTRATTAPASSRAIKPRTASRAKAASAAPATRRTRAAKTEAVAVEESELAGAAPKKRGSRAVAKARPARAAKAAAAPESKAKPKAAIGPTGAGATSRKRATTAVASDTPKAKPASRAQSRKAASPAPRSARSSVAKRMAKAASRLVNAPITAIPTPQITPPATATNGANGADGSLSTQLPSQARAMESPRPGASAFTRGHIGPAGATDGRPTPG